MNFEELILKVDEIRGEKTRRSKLFTYAKIPHDQLEEKISDGWCIDKRSKKDIKIKRSLPKDILFENEVWLLFFNMGFSILSKPRAFNLLSVDSGNFHILAGDEETTLLVLCKSTEIYHEKSDFSVEINDIGLKKVRILNEAKKLFPDENKKIQIIIATKNFAVTDQDKALMKKYGISLFDEETIVYYKELLKHLGKSTKYQLLGNFFSGQNIPELDNVIPAVEGAMGGHTYYAFSIEPEKLLKLGFVLHRNNGNRDEMPAYQRIIKKARLKSVNNFVEQGGFFPNSIVINIVSKKNPRFDLSSLQDSTSRSRIGLLHLPQQYKSIYIIDGQHRLYGYADSEYKFTNTIPVVAFVNLAKEKQIKLFMEINENQKAVSKNLRNTLEADLLWDSENKTEQRQALASQIAQDLGEKVDSPLFDNVIVGENNKTSTCCITIDMIRTAILKSAFLSSYRNTEIITQGLFDKGNNDETYAILYPFLEKHLTYMKKNLYDLWIKGESNNGYVCINIGIHSFIKILSDIVAHLTKDENSPLSSKIFAQIEPDIVSYLDIIIAYLKKLSTEEGLDLRRTYGGSGVKKYWRTLQIEIAKAHTDFNPEGLEDFLKENEKKYNEESFKMIRDIELYMKKDFAEKLKRHYGSDWLMCIPRKVYTAAANLASEKSYEQKVVVNPWDCLHLIDYRTIATDPANWSLLFEKDYTFPGEKGSKDKKTSWMDKLNNIRNKNDHSYSIKEEEYKFIKQIFEWLVDNT